MAGEQKAKLTAQLTPVLITPENVKTAEIQKLLQMPGTFQK